MQSSPAMQRQTPVAVRERQVRRECLPAGVYGERGGRCPGLAAAVFGFGLPEEDDAEDEEADAPADRGYPEVVVGHHGVAVRLQRRVLVQAEQGARRRVVGLVARR